MRPVLHVAIKEYALHTVDVVSSDIWSRIGGNASRRNQSHGNTKHWILDWFGPSRRVIALDPVLMYCAIKINSSLLFFCDVFDVDLPSLFIVGESPHRV
jgi:hypothetical protein